MSNHHPHLGRALGLSSISTALALHEANVSRQGPRRWGFTLPWLGIWALMLGLLLGGCSKSEPVAVGPSPAEVALKQENERLSAEVARLKAQVEDLSQTPEALLADVKKAVAAEDLPKAKSTALKIEVRYGASLQMRQASAEVAALEKRLAEREALAKRMEALGFYALKPQQRTDVGAMRITLESLGLGNRWTFDSHTDEFHYRDVQRGEKFVLMKLTITATNNDHNPNLPEIGVYRIDGKELKRLNVAEYEFRRWSTYGTFIGLHHDFRNDFAHTAAIPFNAAARINEADASKPLAVVATGYFCHERKERIGQPEIAYQAPYNCGEKRPNLSLEDFQKGNARLIGFLNKPQGV